MKPGKETSEFVLTLIPWIMALAVLVLLGLGVVDVEAALVLLAAFGIGGGFAVGKYAESRGVVKAAAAAPPDDEELIVP